MRPINSFGKGSGVLDLLNQGAGLLKLHSIGQSPLGVVKEVVNGFGVYPPQSLLHLLAGNGLTSHMEDNRRQGTLEHTRNFVAHAGAFLFPELRFSEESTVDHVFSDAEENVDDEVTSFGDMLIAGCAVSEADFKTRINSLKHLRGDELRLLADVVDQFCTRMQIGREDVQFAVRIQKQKKGEDKVPDFFHGLVLVDKNDHARVAVLASRKFKHDLETIVTDDEGRIISMQYGVPHAAADLEFSLLISPNEATRSQIRNIVSILTTSSESLEKLNTKGLLHGSLRIGPEYEAFVINKNKKGAPLAKVFGDELLVGMEEPKDNKQDLDPLQAAVRMARTHSQLVGKHSGNWVVSLSTLPTGSPQETEVNVYVDKGGAGPYVAATLGYLAPNFGPTSPESFEVREQQAAVHGYVDVFDMLERRSNGQLWTVAAAQKNAGLPHVFIPGQGHRVDLEVARNTANLMFSELGSVIAMGTASSPLLTGFAPTIYGAYVRDIREFIRDDTGTAAPQNEPIQDVDHLLEIIIETITGERQTDRLDRAAVAHTIANGQYLPTMHGSGRWRITDTGERTGRIELTSAGASSILPRVRAMAIVQIFQAAAMIATAEGKDALDFVGELTDRSADKIWGDAEDTLREFLILGPDSLRMIRVTSRMKNFINNLFARYSLKPLELQRDIALSAMDALRVEGDLHAFAHGKGTMGGALLKYVKLGYSATDITHLVHEFERQEAIAIRLWNRKRPKRLKKYLLGQWGFGFQFPEEVEFARTQGWVGGEQGSLNVAAGRFNASVWNNFPKELRFGCITNGEKLGVLL